MQYLLFLLVIISSCSHRTATISVEERNPYGATFVHERVAEEKSEQGPREFYRLQISPITPGKDFFLLGKTFSEKEQTLYRLSTNEQGKLIANTEKGAIPLSEILFRLGEFRKGEPYQYILVSKDGDARISTTIVPFPIEGVAMDGAKISLIISSADGTVFDCIGEKFQPQEPLSLSVRSGGEETVHRVTADKNGKIRQTIYPLVPGRKGGVATLTLMRRGEIVNLDFNWGREAMQIYTGVEARQPQ